MNRTPLEAWIARRAADDAAGPTGPGSAFDRAALERHQLRRLRDTVGLARRRSRFYRDRLAGASDEIGSLGELQRLPFTTADDIRADPLGFVCVPQGDIGRVVTLDSSGTTGTPKRLYFTPADQALTIDFFEVGMATFTRPGDRVLILLPGETPGSVGDLLATALRNLGAIPIKHGPVRDVRETMQVALAEQATVMVGVPTHLLRLVRAEPAGPVPPVHSILLSTDHVPAAIVAAIESAWGCRVYNHYGMTEMGLGGGVDCAARRGYHLREADLLFEIVEPGGDRPMVDGEQGEVVFTTLTRAGMPLIRYRTGDLGSWLPDPCPCGTGLRTLAHITTRVGSGLTPGARSPLTQADLDEAVFAIDGVLDFAACLRRAGEAMTLEVRVQVAACREPARLRDAVGRVLRALPAVERARVPAGRVRVEVMAGFEPVAEPGLAKRRMVVDG